MKMRQRSSRRWTQRDISELRRLAGEHVRVTAIARQLGRSIASVEARAAFEGIDLKETGRKLAHVEKLLQTPDTIVRDLSERIARDE